MAVRVMGQEPSPGSAKRDANDRIAEKAASLRFVSRVPMLCECGRPGCVTILMIGLDAYRQVRRDPENVLVASGHDFGQALGPKVTSAYAVVRGAHESADSESDRQSA